MKNKNNIVFLSHRFFSIFTYSSKIFRSISHHIVARRLYDWVLGVLLETHLLLIYTLVRIIPLNLLLLRHVLHLLRNCLSHHHHLRLWLVNDNYLGGIATSIGVILSLEVLSHVSSCV